MHIDAFFQLVRFPFTLHWVRESKLIGKPVHLPGCGGPAPRMTEGNNTKTTGDQFAFLYHKI